MLRRLLDDSATPLTSPICQTFHGKIIQDMRAVEAKGEGEADAASARQPLPVAELCMESSARNLNQPASLPMADENRTSGRVPSRNWRLLSQERDRVAILAAGGIVRPNHAQHLRVPRCVRGNGRRISRRTGVDER